VEKVAPEISQCLKIPYVLLFQISYKNDIEVDAKILGKFFFQKKNCWEELYGEKENIDLKFYF